MSPRLDVGVYTGRVGTQSLHVGVPVVAYIHTEFTCGCKCLYVFLNPFSSRGLGWGPVWYVCFVSKEEDNTRRSPVRFWARVVCTVGSGQCGRAGLSIGSVDSSSHQPLTGTIVRSHIHNQVQEMKLLTCPTVMRLTSMMMVQPHSGRWMRTYTQGFHVCVSVYMYMHTMFTFWCVHIYVYVHRVWVGVYVVTYIRTEFACVCVHIYV